MWRDWPLQPCSLPIPRTQETKKIRYEHRREKTNNNLNKDKKCELPEDFLKLKNKENLKYNKTKNEMIDSVSLFLG